MPIGLGVSLGVGGGKPATSSGAPSAPGGDYSSELEYTDGLFDGEGTDYDLGSTSPRMHFMADYATGTLPKPSPSVDDVVDAWSDCSGNDLDFSQSTASSRGVYKEPGGIAGLYFAYSDRYEIASPEYWSQEMTLFLVGYASDPDNNTYSLGPMGHPSEGPMTYYGTDRHKMRVWSGSFGSANTMDSLNLYTVTRGPTSGGTQDGWWQGGNLDVTSAAGSSGTSSNPLSYIGQSGGYTTGYCMEIIYFQSELSVSDRNIVGDYLANKYSITVDDWS